MTTTAPFAHDAGEDLLVERRGAALVLTFNRPRARNAMTTPMYEALVAACDHVDATPDIRALGLRGAGGRAFVAGTDISQFRGFTGTDGIAYERQIGEVLGRLRAVDVPVVAAIEGHCVGGGLGIATCADIRLAAPSAKFGIPIASTLGNTLSAGTLQRLVALLGESRVTHMLLTSQPFDADTAVASGFAVAADDLEADFTALLERLTSLAPLTQWSIKELLRRNAQAAASGGGPVDDSDVVEKIYGSEDFAGAVAGFLDKTPWTWLGR